ncbi:MAG: MATE family efflux transporter [Bauldia sp.]|nr:MATE family efflux transporter [Bauldia sp.]
MIDIARPVPAARGAWAMEARATLSLAWPMIITQMAQMALGVTDVVFMGWLGPDAVAAGALAVNLNLVFLIFCIGLVTATAPMIAIELGRARHSVRDVRRSVRQGFWAAATASVPVWIILWNGEAILVAIGQDPALAEQAGSYLRTLQWGGLPFLCYIVLRNFIGALERPRAAMVVAVAAFFVNAGLVYSLMFGALGLPSLGLSGAGIGTSLTNLFMFLSLAAIISIDRRFRRYSLFGRLWRPDWARYREIWRLGLPIALTLTFEVGVFNVAAFMMGLVGADALAAHAIAMQFPSLTFMAMLGFALAATVRVGLAYGRGDHVAIGRAGWTAFAMAMVIALITAITMIFAGRPLVGVFLDLSDPANETVIALAVTFLAFAGLFQFFDAGQVSASGMLRGLGDTKVPMIIAGIGYWGVGMTLCVLLGFVAGFGGIGIWVGLVAALGAVAIPLTIRWMRRDRLGLTTQPAPDASHL